MQCTTATGAPCCTQAAFRLWGGGPGSCCPTTMAPGQEAPCSATTVTPKMAVKRGQREGNAPKPLTGRNVAGNSLGMNLSESLKCNTLMSGKLSSVPGEDRMVPTPQQSCPCAGRGFLSPGGCTLGITVAASFVLTLEI